MARRRTGPTLVQRSRSKAPGQKAVYHQVFGAGKRHVKREFFDLSDDDMAVLARELDRRIGQRLARDAG